MLTKEQLADVPYLEALENGGAFYPCGWLYQAVYGRLADEGLVVRTHYGDGFRIADAGLARLTESRLSVAEGAAP